MKKRKQFVAKAILFAMVLTMFAPMAMAAAGASANPTRLDYSTGSAGFKNITISFSDMASSTGQNYSITASSGFTVEAQSASPALSGTVQNAGFSVPVKVKFDGSTGPGTSDVTGTLTVSLGPAPSTTTLLSVPLKYTAPTTAAQFIVTDITPSATGGAMVFTGTSSTIGNASGSFKLAQNGGGSLLADITASGPIQLSKDNANWGSSVTGLSVISTVQTIYVRTTGTILSSTNASISIKTSSTSSVNATAVTIPVTISVTSDTVFAITRDFGSVIEGYTTVPQLSFTVTNNTSSNAAFSVLLSDTSRFTFANNTGSSFTVGSNSSYTGYVQPVLGLAAGNYPLTLTLRNSSGSTVDTDSTTFYVTTSGSNSTTMYAREITHSSTGIKVTVSATSSAALSVTANSLHSSGSCVACDKIRDFMGQGNVLKCYNISLPSGSYSGSATVSIPVGSTYNGRMVTMLHCNHGSLEQRNVVVAGGHAAGLFSSLSPFAVLDGEYSVVSDGSSSGGNNNNNSDYDPPKTGDDKVYFSWGALLITAALLMAVLCGMYLIKRYGKKPEEA